MPTPSQRSQCGPRNHARSKGFYQPDRRFQVHVENFLDLCRRKAEAVARRQPLRRRTKESSLTTSKSPTGSPQCYEYHDQHPSPIPASLTLSVWLEGQSCCCWLTAAGIFADGSFWTRATTCRSKLVCNFISSFYGIFPSRADSNPISIFSGVHMVIMASMIQCRTVSQLQFLQARMHRMTMRSA